MMQASVPNIPDAYQKAAGVANASPAAKVEALTRLAGAERDRAVALMAEADRMDAELLRFIGSTNRQAVRIQSNNTVVAGLSALEPTKARQATELTLRPIGPVAPPKARLRRNVSSSFVCAGRAAHP